MWIKTVTGVMYNADKLESIWYATTDAYGKMSEDAGRVLVRGNGEVATLYQGPWFLAAGVYNSLGNAIAAGASLFDITAAEKQADCEAQHA